MNLLFRKKIVYYCFIKRYSFEVIEEILLIDERINAQSTIELFKDIESKHKELNKIYILTKF
ncbi:MAG TPA: hypothetical protein PK351_12890 [Spirochaetota bacterium]|nr:hypothetical protein [Spirochaetota bacterium]HPP05706.1 hypothetical protein [Spirochaetota bacterium]